MLSLKRWLTILISKDFQVTIVLLVFRLVETENLHNRPIFDLGKSRQKKPNSRKNILKAVKFQNLVAKFCTIWKI